MDLSEATDLLLDLEGIYGNDNSAKEMFLQIVMKESSISDTDADTLYFRCKNGIFYGKQKDDRKKKYEELFREFETCK
jgi:hypothetical protein